MNVPLHGNFELHPLGVSMENAVSMNCVWSIHTKTQLVGRRQPMTSLPARPQYKGRRENTSFTYFVFTDCFVWSVHSGKSTVFYQLSWGALARRFRSVWICVLAIWHPIILTIFASFVWARSKHEMSSRGQSAYTVSFFLWKSSALVCPSFEEGGAAVWHIMNLLKKTWLMPWWCKQHNKGYIVHFEIF